jgi:hypothetical protein
LDVGREEAGEDVGGVFAFGDGGPKEFLDQGSLSGTHEGGIGSLEVSPQLTRLRVERIGVYGRER